MAGHANRNDLERNETRTDDFDIRHLAIVLAAQLPPDQADALAVVDQLRALVTGYMFTA